MKCDYCRGEFDKKKGWVEATKKVETISGREVCGIIQIFCSPGCMANGAEKLFKFNTG